MSANEQYFPKINNKILTTSHITLNIDNIKDKNKKSPIMNQIMIPLKNLKIGNSPIKDPNRKLTTSTKRKLVQFDDTPIKKHKNNEALTKNTPENSKKLKTISPVS